MHHAINEYQLRLDVQCFLWPVNYITLNAHKLVVQVAEWITASLSGLASHELTISRLVQALKIK